VCVLRAAGDWAATCGTECGGKGADVVTHHEHGCRECKIAFWCKKGLCAPWVEGEVTVSVCPTCGGLLRIIGEAQQMLATRKKEQSR
jgi:hypothetical protein